MEMRARVDAFASFVKLVRQTQMMGCVGRTIAMSRYRERG